MNRLFVAYKPSGIGSNLFLSRLKRKYNNKKAGFSGTLDPFAKGVLIIGMGSHTKLFRFLDKTPKKYRATLWLGAKSDSLDIEMIEQVDILPAFSDDTILEVVKSLEGTLEYTPPIFSAKQINGQRAYDLARAGKEVVLNKINSTIYETQLLHYRHPFVTFEATVSEGSYIRSLGQIIATRLGVEHGSLSALERLSEGVFRYNGEKVLDIKKSLNIPRN
ncbi:MAG: tRNA pseudouridine(55) synthase TruB, partial [Sulfurimonas sp.]|nr:tRNA pseudouridine(55) synthase TruB [Sulfurimonas sp.]